MADLSGAAQDQFVASCSAYGGNDLLFAWEAPQNGCATVDTLSGEMDTILVIFDSCGGSEIACNDDADSASAIHESSLSFDVTAGTSYVIGLDAWSYSVNSDYVLDINITPGSCN